MKISNASPTALVFSSWSDWILCSSSRKEDRLVNSPNWWTKLFATGCVEGIRPKSAPVYAIWCSDGKAGRARAAEVQALTTYNSDLAEMRRVEVTLLSARNVLIERATQEAAPWWARF